MLRAERLDLPLVFSICFTTFWGGVFRIMKLRYIEVFLALAQTPNMRDVAHALFVTQAAISSSLRDFEEEIGVQLFDRVGRSIHLNENGRILKKRLEPIYHQFNNIFSLLSTDALVGKLFIGASFTLANWVVPQLLYTMKKTYPHVELECYAKDGAEIVRKVEGGQWDMGLVEGDVNSVNLRVTHLGSEELVIVTADKELASQPQRMESLMKKLWLLHEKGSGTREIFLRNIAPLGLHPEQYLELTHTNAIKRVLQNPDTLACLSPHSIELELKYNILHIVPLENMKFTQNFYCVERPNNAFTVLRKTLVAELQSYIRQS